MVTAPDGTITPMPGRAAGAGDAHLQHTAAMSRASSTALTRCAADAA